MPIPFLIAGLGVAAGVVGTSSHISARNTNKKAKEKETEAKNIYDRAESSLNNAEKRVEKELERIGYRKKKVLDSSMNKFIISYDKIKHIKVIESSGLNEILNFTIDKQDIINIKKMSSINVASFQGGMTGLAIGLAANGSLSFIAKNVAKAGVSSAVGDSALLFGMTPLVAPILLFSGLAASMKADENYEKATVMYEQVLAEVEKMKVSETLYNSISKRSAMFYDLLEKLDKMFSESSFLLEKMIQTKEKKKIGERLTSEDFSQEELNLIAVTRSLAGAIKSVIDTPILSQEGNISEESEKVYDKTVERLPDFNRAVNDVKASKFEGKPIETKSKEVESQIRYEKKSEIPNNFSIIRSIIGFLLGFVLANKFSASIAAMMPYDYYKIIFIEARVLNKMAVWLLICISVMMIVGKLKGSSIEKWSSFAIGISFFILYIQYCRIIIRMNHPIIFSIIVFIVGVVMWYILDERKDELSGANFISVEFLCVALCAGIGLIYLLLCIVGQILGIPYGFWLVITSILMLICSTLGMLIFTDESSDI